MNSHQSVPDANSTTPDAAPKTAGTDHLSLETGSVLTEEGHLAQDDDEKQPEYKNLARPLFDFITSRVSDFDRGGHTELMSFSNFKAFWRNKFETMRLELAHSHEDELFISDPPLKEVEIEILNIADEHYCACDLDYVDAQIFVRAEQGITRDAILIALKDHLYSEEVKSEHLRLSDHHCGMLIPRDWEYMETDEDVLYQQGRYDRMRIWVCCSDKAIPHEQRQTKL